MSFAKVTQNVAKVVMSVENGFNSAIRPAVEIPAVSLFILYLLVLNVVFSWDEVPYSVQKVIKHPVTRVLSVFLGLYIALNQSFVSALIGTLIVFGLIFMFSKLKENFDMVWPEPDSYPGCSAVKMADLLNVFDGDKAKLKYGMETAGVPFNVELNDHNAPLIATYLINQGHKITQQCRLS